MNILFRLLSMAVPVVVAYLDHRTKVKEAEAQRDAARAAAEAILARQTAAPSLPG